MIEKDEVGYTYRNTRGADPDHTRETRLGESYFLCVTQARDRGGQQSLGVDQRQGTLTSRPWGDYLALFSFAT